MAVITINRDSYSMGKVIAEGLASELGYKCIGDEVFAATSKGFGIAETKIRSALEDAPTFWGIPLTTRSKLISCYQSTLARLLLDDNVVYYGPAGHLLIQGVSHVLKVYLQSDIEARVQLKAKTEDITGGKALKKLLKEDKGHSKLTSFLYGINGNEEGLCDMVINTGKAGMKDVIRTISVQALSKRYRTTTYSVNCLKNIELSFRVRAALIDVDRDVSVRAASGSVFIHARATEGKRQKLVDTVRNAAKSIRDVANVEVIITEDIFERYAETYR
ncbi:MAG: cytidylate kinase-like family protein [Nitrospirae bacterium]|nr:cytidylate kinase-like family protein [Nitrospirota bacterium]